MHEQHVWHSAWQWVCIPLIYGKIRERRNNKVRQAYQKNGRCIFPRLSRLLGGMYHSLRRRWAPCKDVSGLRRAKMYSISGDEDAKDQPAVFLIWVGAIDCHIALRGCVCTYTVPFRSIRPGVWPVTRWTKFCVRPPALYGARRSRRGLPEPSQAPKMAQKRPVTRDTVSISAKPPKCAARDAQ